jgi:hypothetical protein
MGTKMTERSDVAQTLADLGAATSTATIAAYSFTDFLEQGALMVAILSGSLAAAWHVYKFYQAYKHRKGANDGTTGNTSSD